MQLPWQLLLMHGLTLGDFYRGENMFSTSMNIDMDGTSDLSE